MNGPQFDLADDVVWDQLMYDVAAGEYAAGLACPDLSSFSKYHGLPGHAPRRDVDGPGRYGMKKLAPDTVEKMCLHNLVGQRGLREVSGPEP